MNSLLQIKNCYYLITCFRCSCHLLIFQEWDLAGYLDFLCSQFLYLCFTVTLRFRWVHFFICSLSLLKSQSELITRLHCGLNFKLINLHQYLSYLR